jgi:hypothetical protein
MTRYGASIGVEYAGKKKLVHPVAAEPVKPAAPKPAPKEFKRTEDPKKD